MTTNPDYWKIGQTQQQQTQKWFEQLNQQRQLQNEIAQLIKGGKTS